MERRSKAGSEADGSKSLVACKELEENRKSAFQIRSLRERHHPRHAPVSKIAIISYVNRRACYHSLVGYHSRNFTTTCFVESEPSDVDGSGHVKVTLTRYRSSWIIEIPRARRKVLYI